MKKEKIITRELLTNPPKNRNDLAVFKRKISKKYKISCPDNIQLLKAYHKSVRIKRIKKSEKLEELLRKRPVRSLSGIINVSVLTKPYLCPGRCLYCPQEKGIPKSYLSGEPAVERAKKLDFNPYLQVKKRLEMLKSQGHPSDKVELRIIGGTWSFYPRKYRQFFVKRCFEACNGRKSKTLARAQKNNEKARCRIVGLSVETRPDFINRDEIIILRQLGVTKVELGIQSVFDDVLRKNQRGHGRQEIIEATRLLKDAGFKVSYQLMVNLPGSRPKKDLEVFRQVFNNNNFCPDLIKIYPCALIKEAPLFRLYQKGKYRPYRLKTLLNIIKKVKKITPSFVRIERIARDIPAPKIVCGPAKISNLRQVLQREMAGENLKCHCIRCREIKSDYGQNEKIFLFRQDYPASEGREIFLSFENKSQSRLYSLLRLRIPGKLSSQFSVLENAAIIRELHTFGQMIPLSQRKKAAQHRGLGRKLVSAAEKIVKNEFNLPKIVSISAVGARPYWRKTGYRLGQTYMVKCFS